MPIAAGYGVSTPAARAECGVSSGAAEFGDVAGVASRGLEWTRRGRGAVSGVICQIRIVGIVIFRLLRVSNLSEHQIKAVFGLKLMVGGG